MSTGITSKLAEMNYPAHAKSMDEECVAVECSMVGRKLNMVAPAGNRLGCACDRALEVVFFQLTDESV